MRAGAAPALTPRGALAPQEHEGLKTAFTAKQSELEKLERLVESTMSVRATRPPAGLDEVPVREGTSARSLRRAEGLRAACEAALTWHALPQRWRGVGSSSAGFISAPVTPATSRSASPAFGAAPATPQLLPPAPRLPSSLPPSGKAPAFGLLAGRAGLGDMSILWRR